MLKGFLLKAFYLPTNVLKSIAGKALHKLSEPTRLYAPSEVTDLRALKRRLRVGDVLLISGHARISHAVKVLTVSQWSHVVMYVGDRRDLLSQEEIDEWSERYGYSSLEHLIIDADPIRGVHLKPLDESVGLMMRHCRAEAISQEDLNKVIERALSQLGLSYDLMHVINLLIFFAFPWEILPVSWRRLVTEFTLSESDRICSRVLSEAFHSVGYPIRPMEVIQNRGVFHRTAVGFASGVVHRGRSSMRLFTGGRIKAALQRLSNKRYLELSFKRTRYITPTDYDLSRFFSVIKDSDDLSINYRRAKQLTPEVE